MQTFRNLADNILFKIFLAFIALAFVLWGVSGFILASPNSWVAKVGGKTISQNTFLREVEKNRNLIVGSNSSKEATKYLNSQRFQSDVLNRLVNQVIVEKISDDVGVKPSKTLILQEIAKNPNLKGADGKFSQKQFQKLLTQNGLDETSYVKLAQNELAASIVSQTLTLVAPVNDNFAIAQEEFKQQTRTADVVTISQKNVKKVASPKKKAVTEFFEENKAQYDAPQYRKVSYISFSIKDFAKNIKVTQKEVKRGYEDNKSKFFNEEARDIYHLLFDSKEEADAFVTKLDAKVSKKSNISYAFAHLAKTLQKKSKKEISLTKVSKKDLMPELSNAIFKLELRKHSQPIKSSLGYHVFLLNKIHESGHTAFAQVKKDIEKEIKLRKEQKIMQQKVGKIDDSILASNSLEKAVEEFSLKPVKTITIAGDGNDEKGKKVNKISKLSNFTKNAFATKQGESSKVFYSKDNKEYYCLKIEEITPSRNRELKEVYYKVKKDLTAKLQAEKLKVFADKIAAQVKEKPANIRKIAYRNHLKLEKNKDFPRTYYINYQGKQIPFANKFLGDLFGLEIGQASAVNQQGQEEYSIAVLKKINTPKLDENQINNARLAQEKSFKEGVLQGYNAVMMKKYPVSVNQEMFKTQ